MSPMRSNVFPSLDVEAFQLLRTMRQVVSGAHGETQYQHSLSGVPECSNTI